MRSEHRYFQIERQSHRPPARATVQVHEAADGQLEIRYRDRVMRWTEVAAPLPEPGRPRRHASRCYRRHGHGRVGAARLLIIRGITDVEKHRRR